MVDIIRVKKLPETGTCLDSFPITQIQARMLKTKKNLSVLFSCLMDYQYWLPHLETIVLSEDIDIARLTVALQGLGPSPCVINAELSHTPYQSAYTSDGKTLIISLRTDENPLDSLYVNGFTEDGSDKRSVSNGTDADEDSSADTSSVSAASVLRHDGEGELPLYDSLEAYYNRDERENVSQTTIQSAVPLVLQQAANQNVCKIDQFTLCTGQKSIDAKRVTRREGPGVAKQRTGNPQRQDPFNLKGDFLSSAEQFTPLPPLSTIRDYPPLSARKSLKPPAQLVREETSPQSIPEETSEQRNKALLARLHLNEDQLDYWKCSRGGKTYKKKNGETIQVPHRVYAMLAYIKDHITDVSSVFKYELNLLRQKLGKGQERSWSDYFSFFPCARSEKAQMLYDETKNIDNILLPPDKRVPIF